MPVPLIYVSDRLIRKQKKPFSPFNECLDMTRALLGDEPRLDIRTSTRCLYLYLQLDLSQYQMRTSKHKTSPAADAVWIWIIKQTDISNSTSHRSFLRLCRII
jgi:hypothetical protein